MITNIKRRIIQQEMNLLKIKNTFLLYNLAQNKNNNNKTNNFNKMIILKFLKT